mgnify:CR=1 FL=1
MNSLKTYQIILLFLLLSVTVIIFTPILNAEYAKTDDWVMLKSYSGTLKNISLNYIINTFKNSHEGLYHPLVTLSYSLEVMIFGFVPAIFHFDNILLHLLNIVLVFLLFFKLSKNNYWISFIITVLFAIHPTRVEVVSWISARKDLLYAPFYLLSILFYLKYNERTTKIPDCHADKSACNDGQWQIYTSIHLYLYTSIFFFLLSCFSKSMAITLPFLLILIDWYTNNLNRKKFKIYLPYFIIAIVFIFIAIKVHYPTNYINSNFSLFNHFINFINAHFNILFYFDKLFLPINLYCMYPYFYKMTTMPPWFIMYSPAVLYILIFFSFLSLKKYKIKTIFFGIFFFLITILPTSGMLKTGDFMVADRYTYLPYLGLFFIIAKFIIFIFRKYNRIVKSFIICICISVFLIFGYLSSERIFDWIIDAYGPPVIMEYYEFGLIKSKARYIRKYKIRKFLDNLTSLYKF